MHFSCHIHRSRYLPDVITPKPSVSPIQGMILEKLNLGVAQIEYGVLNSTLEYKWLPGGCGNWQVQQFNPPHSQQLPMRRELVWHQHLSAWIWNKFTCPQILVHCLMYSFSSHTLVQLLYNLHLQDVEIWVKWSYQFTSEVIRFKEQWSH